MEKNKNNKKETSLISDAVKNRCNNYSNNLNPDEYIQPFLL